MQLDPRFVKTVNLIKDGTFGWADFFEPLVASITSGGDYYLLANDFPSYIEAQVFFCCTLLLMSQCISLWIFCIILQSILTTVPTSQRFGVYNSGVYPCGDTHQ